MTNLLTLASFRRLEDLEEFYRRQEKNLRDKAVYSLGDLDDVEDRGIPIELRVVPTCYQHFKDLLETAESVRHPRTAEDIEKASEVMTYWTTWEDLMQEVFFALANKRGEADNEFDLDPLVRPVSRQDPLMIALLSRTLFMAHLQTERLVWTDLYNGKVVRWGPHENERGYRTALYSEQPDAMLRTFKSGSFRWLLYVSEPRRGFGKWDNGELVVCYRSGSMFKYKTTRHQGSPTSHGHHLVAKPALLTDSPSVFWEYFRDNIKGKFHAERVEP